MLAKWEREIMDDARAYYPGGQAAPALDSPPDGEVLDAHAATLLRMLGTSYPDFVYLGQGQRGALSFMAFSFESLKGPSPARLYDEQITRLEKAVGPDALLNHAFRMYFEEIVLLVKPSVLRFWTRTQAVHDVDHIIADILKTDEEEQPPHAEA